MGEVQNIKSATVFAQQTHHLNVTNSLEAKMKKEERDAWRERCGWECALSRHEGLTGCCAQSPELGQRIQVQSIGLPIGCYWKEYSLRAEHRCWSSWGLQEGTEHVSPPRWCLEKKCGQVDMTPNTSPGVWKARFSRWFSTRRRRIWPRSGCSLHPRICVCKMMQDSSVVPLRLCPANLTCPKIQLWPWI